jgi:hypothetical protein
MAIINPKATKAETREAHANTANMRSVREFLFLKIGIKAIRAKNTTIAASWFIKRRQ